MESTEISGPTGGPSESPAGVLLTRRLLISRHQYALVEGAFRDLLRSVQFPLAQRLIALRVLVEFLGIVHQKEHGAFEPMGESRPAGPEIASALKALSATGYEAVFRSAGRSGSSPVIQRMFLGMMTSFGSARWSGRGRMTLAAGLVAEYARHAAGVGGVRMKPLENKVSHRKLQRGRFPLSGSGLEALEHYAGRRIESAELLEAPHVARGLDLALINAALVRWYAVAGGEAQGRAQPEDDDWPAAVARAEIHYGAGSEFEMAVSHHPMLEELLESFAHRKNFPFVILSEVPL